MATIQPASKLLLVQAMPVLLGQTVTGELRRTASERARSNDMDKSLTVARTADLACICLQEGSANVAMSATSATATITSTRVKPRSSRQAEEE